MCERFRERTWCALRWEDVASDRWFNKDFYSKQHEHFVILIDGIQLFLCVFLYICWIQQVEFHWLTHVFFPSGWARTRPSELMNTSGQVIYRANSPDIFCDVLWRCDSEYTKKQHFASEIQDWDWRRRQQLFDKNLYDVDKWWSQCQADIVFGWEKKKPLKVNC